MADLIDFKSPLLTERHKQNIINDTPNLDTMCDNIKPIFTTDLWQDATDYFDIGRESVPFTNRPSLLITNTQSVLSPFRNEHMEQDERESLGILHSLSPLRRLSASSNSFLNTGFLLHTNHVDRRLSALSSISSINSPNFFDSPFVSYTQNYFEDAFLVSSIKAKSQMDIFHDDFNADMKRERIASLPVQLLNDNEVKGQFCDSPKVEECKEIIEEANFNDSVFIEANHLASKIADGSIFDENLDADDEFLDNTSPPELYSSDVEEEEEEKPIKCDTETVFKTIDKFLPPSTITTTTTNESDEHKTTISPTNCDRSSSKSSSKDAKELIQNLSEIISSECHTSEQKRHGQSLLSDLADMLMYADQKDDSDKENALDLRVSKSTSDVILDLSMRKNDENGRHLSQSYTSTGFTPPVVAGNLKKQTVAMKAIAFSSLDRNSMCSNDSKGSIGSSTKSISSSFSTKLKQRKADDAKKGPLKAIIPMNSLTKKTLDIRQSKIPTTPPKRQSLKRTSTPKTNDKMKFAQSTPDDQKTRSTSSSSQLKKKFPCPLSPLTRSSTLYKSINNTSDLNKSDSLPSLTEVKAKIPTLNRRRSASDIKGKDSRLPMKRSNSIGKDDKKIIKPVIDMKRKLRDSNGNYGLTATDMIRNLRKKLPN